YFSTFPGSFPTLTRGRRFATGAFPQSHKLVIRRRDLNGRPGAHGCYQIGRFASRQTTPAFQSLPTNADVASGSGKPTRVVRQGASGRHARAGESAPRTTMIDSTPGHHESSPESLAAPVASAPLAPSPPYALPP